MKLETIAERFVDPEPPDFFDELWERAEADATRRAKRWRLIAVALAIVAVAALGAAAVLAARSGAGVAAAGTKTIDRTLLCGAKTDLGTGLRIGAEVKERGAVWWLVVSPGETLNLPGTGAYAVASGLVYDYRPDGTRVVVKNGYEFNDTVCARTAKIPLSPSGLPRLGTFVPGGPGYLRTYCPNATAPLFIRMRVTTKNGVPQAARLAVRVGRKRRPVSYIDWTQNRFTAYGSNGCLQQ